MQTLVAKSLKIKYGAGVGNATKTLVVRHLSSFIKYNKNLLHLDLSSTGLCDDMLKCFGVALRRAKTLLSLHLSGNPGVTPQVKAYLKERAHCVDKEEPLTELGKLIEA